MNKKKLTTTAVALATSAALLLGGTFAWQSINQTALNEASDIVNPGGRLHDDFNGEDKNVYVENFADDEIFARVRFDEYFEIIMNYNSDAETSEKIVGEVREDTSTYVTRLFGEENATDDYWNWTMGGEDSAAAYYMPTFNLNKDSLVADVNGVFNGANFTITDKEDGDQYATYVDYSLAENADKRGYEIYDGDVNGDDEDITAEMVADIVENGDISAHYDADALVLTEDKVTHSAAQVGTTRGFISMSEWQEKNDEGEPTDRYWVYDTDGWVYWSSPIAGRNGDGTTNTTGLLLDGIELAQVMDDTWYYAINVVAQFVTADDVGKTDGTGFYDEEHGSAPTEAAEAFLDAIGVDMSGEAGENGDDEDGEIVTLVLSRDGENKVTIARGEKVKIAAEDDGADLSAVLIDGGEWEEGSDWTYDPETRVLTLTGPDSYYGVADKNDTYSGEVWFEAEPEYTMVLSDRYVNPGDEVTVEIYNDSEELVSAELSVSDRSTVDGNTVTIAEDSSGEVTVTATIDGVQKTETLFVASADAVLTLSIAPATEKEVYIVGEMRLNVTATVDGVDVLDYIDCEFEVSGPEGNDAYAGIDEEDDERVYRLFDANIPGEYSVTMTAEGATAATDELLFDREYTYEIYLNGEDTYGGSAFLPINGEEFVLTMVRGYYDWDADPYYQSEVLTDAEITVSAGTLGENGSYTPASLDEGEFVSDTVTVTAAWTDDFGMEHTAVTYLAFYDDTQHSLATFGGGSINDDTYEEISIYLFGDENGDIFTDDEGTYYCILIKYTDYDAEDTGKMYESKELKKYYTNVNSFGSDSVHEGWASFEPCGH